MHAILPRAVKMSGPQGTIVLGFAGPDEDIMEFSIPDTSVLVGADNRPLGRTPTFVLLPGSAEPLRIAKETIPAITMDGIGEVMPAREVPAKVKVNRFICPTCLSVTEKSGFRLEQPSQGEPNILVQCGNCHALHFLVVEQK